MLGNHMAILSSHFFTFLRHNTLRTEVQGGRVLWEASRVNSSKTTIIIRHPRLAVLSV
ncbi:hypothetical protein E2C01_084661 [Portunus trituberculatus]|uniref:Uncharacterized protein n=1 Tax=Portunus trituberculatus TaxID=210409 RepID=A0A5B7JBB0_PORTR|nr:hypothetical protein [Portunus trituberculatus]